MTALTLSDGQLTLFRILLAFLISKFSQSAIFAILPDAYAYPISIAVMMAIFLLILSAFSSPRRLSVRNILQSDTKKLNVSIVLLSLISIVLFKYGTAVIYYTYHFLLGTTESLGLEEYSEKSRDITNSFFSIELITKAFMAPIAEEIVYRGVILGYLFTKYIENAAIIIGSVIFGTFHGLDGFAMAFLGGVFLCTIYA